MMARLSIGLFLMGAIACGTSHTVQLPAGTWNLTRLLGEDASAYKRPVTFTLDTAQSRASGFAGCNQYFSTYTAKNSLIRFREVGSTKMYCEEGMKIEDEYLELLGQVRSFKLANNKLSLLKGDSVLLEFTRNP